MGPSDHIFPRATDGRCAITDARRAIGFVAEENLPRTARRLLLLGVLVVVACGGSSQESPAAAEYAKDIERLVGTMNATIDAHDDQADSGSPSIEKERVRFAGGLAARDDFLNGIADLDPPAALADLHSNAVVIIEDLRDRTKDLGDIAQSAATMDEFTSAWQGAPGDAFRAADGRSIELCLQVETFFRDSVTQGVEFASPWMQTAAAQPLDINLGCLEAAR